MVKMITAFTEEFDDINAMMIDINQQINKKGGLLKNSVGIFSCYDEFWDTGAIKAMSKLPFPTIGVTTGKTGINGVSGTLLMGLSVLTSDDVTFATQLSEFNATDRDEKIYNSCAKINDEFGKPKMLMLFAPYSHEITGDTLVDGVDKVFADVPLVGTLAWTHRLDGHNSALYYNGAKYENGCALIGFCGNFTPKLHIMSLRKKSVLSEKAIITKSNRNMVYEINGMSATDYLKSRGFEPSYLLSLPFLITFADGSVVTRTVMPMSKGDNCLYFSGKAPENSAINVGYMTEEDVLSTTDDILSQIYLPFSLNDDGVNGVFLFDCSSRRVVLEANDNAPFDKVTARCGGGAFHIISSGGEFCAVRSDAGANVNRCHNFALVACVIE